MKKKQAVLRTRKSIGQGQSDSDDFKPIKAKVTGKRRSDEGERPAVKKVKRYYIESSDSEEGGSMYTIMTS